MADIIQFNQEEIKSQLGDLVKQTVEDLTEISTSPFVLEGIDDAEDESEQDRSIYLAVADQSRAATG